MSYLPAADESATDVLDTTPLITTTDVVDILKNPGGGLVVPAPPKPFPFVPVALGLLAVALLLGGKS